MKINILLPHKEKFDLNLASSVSITVRNNLQYSNYKKHIRVFGSDVSNPIYPENFIGIKNSNNIFKSNNKHLAMNMIMLINKSDDEKQLIEIHNRPYLFNLIKSRLSNYPISIFFHNDPTQMKGSKLIRERIFMRNHAEYIYCVSDFIKKKFLQGVDNLHNNVKVVHNGVDRRLQFFPNKKNIILFVGRIVKEKGVELFVKSCKELAKVFPNWNFGIIGSTKLGFKDARSNYEKRITKEFTEIGKQAVLYGFLNHEDVQIKMSEASIVIIPSLWEEPFGLVVAEAMSNGCAVICSKIGGIPEIIKGNGITIDNIDHKKIINEASKLMSNSKYLLQMQKKSWSNFEHSSQISSKKLDRLRAKIIN